MTTPSAQARFRPGDAIAWRGCIRMDATGIEHPLYANAMTVVHDTPDELALLRCPGHLLKQRLADSDGPPDFRHPVVRQWLDGWSEQIWREPWRVLVLKQPGSEHAISLFSDHATGAPGFWYIDLIGPVRRTPAGFDFPEHGLDVVVPLDLAFWKWKDEDELEFNVSEGRYTRAQADGLYAEGERAVEHLRRERAAFERWFAWRPDTAWPLPELPFGWDVL